MECAIYFNLNTTHRLRERYLRCCNIIGMEYAINRYGRKIANKKGITLHQALFDLQQVAFYCEAVIIRKESCKTNDVYTNTYMYVCIHR